MKISYKNQIKFLVFVSVIVTICYSKPLDIVGYSSVSQVNDIVERDGKLWIATPGGLFNYSPDTKEQYHYRDLSEMPSLNITTLALDSSYYLWAGTESGHIYRVDQNGRLKKNSDYFAKGWNINDISIYGKYLLIASNMGFSLFDAQKMKVVQSSNTIGTFSSPTINVVKYIEGVLTKNSVQQNVKRIYLGMLGGYAWYDIVYDDLSQENFYNSTIWKEVKDSAQFVYHIDKYKDSLITSGSPVLVSNDSIYSIKDNSLYLFEDKLVNFNHSDYECEVKSLIKSENLLWVGTGWDFLYSVIGKKRERVVLNGIRFQNTNRVMIASDGSLWIMPNTGQEHNQTLNIGVTKEKNGKWTFFEKYKNNFGKLADWNESFGVEEDKNGDMWFGFSGGNIKKYSINERKWYRYQIASGNRVDFKLVPENEDAKWGKCDLIYNDNNGYLWMSSWKGAAAGAILCYDPNIVNPKDGDYRYFFPESGDNYIDNVLSLSEDSCGNFILGGYGGDLVMFTYDGNPIKDGVNEPFFNYEKSNNSNLQKVYDIASAPDSTSWIASARGLFIYSNARGEVLDSRKFDEIPFSGNVNSIEVGEYSKIFDTSYVTLWCSSENEGIIKTTVTYVRSETGNIQNLRLINDSIVAYNEENGLISNFVNQIFLDKNTGYLWAATNSGVAAVFDGNPYKERTDSRDISVFPNPFIKKIHTKLTFQHLAPEAQVMIYSLDGKLIANLNEDNSEMVKTGKEWTYYWTPSEKVKPGTYIYTGTTRGDKGYSKLLILP